MNTETDLIPHSTITAMVDNWTVLCAKIENADETLRHVDKQLHAVFGDGVSLSGGVLFNSADVKKELLRSVWSAIIGKTEIKRYLSLERQKELDRNIHEGNVDELTAENILKMLKSAAFNIPTLMNETIKEVFELLRPYNTGYKNNEKFAGELGKKVVLEGYVEKTWKSSQKFEVGYYRRDKIRAINNAFYLLDGKGYPETYHGDLYDSIHNAEGGVGESQYFRFRCYGNGNLHLEFKRLDLVKKMNGMAAGNVLRKAV